MPRVCRTRARVSRDHLQASFAERRLRTVPSLPAVPALEGTSHGVCEWQPGKDEVGAAVDGAHEVDLVPFFVDIGLIDADLVTPQQEKFALGPVEVQSVLAHIAQRATQVGWDGTPPAVDAEFVAGVVAVPGIGERDEASWSRSKADVRHQFVMVFVHEIHVQETDLILRRVEWSV